MENNENVREEIVEVHVDCDNIVIPISRFEELITKESTLKFIELAYKKVETYKVKDILEIVFSKTESEK